jgi:hypothetical protein
MSKTIDIVEQDNWVGLYIDDNLEMCDHSLKLFDVLELLQDTVFFVHSVIHAYNWEKDLPENLRDLIEDGQTKTIGELNG